MKKYTKAKNSMNAQKKKIEDLSSNINKMKYIIEDYYSIIEHSGVDKDNNSKLT